MQISFSPESRAARSENSNNAVIFLVDDKTAKEGTYADLVKSDRAFGGKTGQVLSFPYEMVMNGTDYRKGYLLGVGKVAELKALAAEAIGSKIAGLSNGSGYESISVSAELLSAPVEPK